MPLIPARFVVSQSSRIHSVCGAVRGAAMTAIVLSATGLANAGGGFYTYGDLAYCTVTSLTIDIDGSWAAPYEARPITSVDFTANAGPYTSLSGDAAPSPSANGYDYLADSQTLQIPPNNVSDRLSARTDFYNSYPNDQAPYPTIKDGFVEWVLNVTSTVTIDLSGQGTSGGTPQSGLVVTLDGTSISSGATLGVGTRTLRYTWTNFSHIGNQFGMFATLNAVPTAVPGGGATGLALLAMAGVAGRRRR